jgi:hypothetical protein
VNYDEAETAYREAFTKLAEARIAKLYADEAVMRREVEIKQVAARQGSNADQRKALFEQACEDDDDLKEQVDRQRGLMSDLILLEGEDRIARKRMDWLIEWGGDVTVVAPAEQEAPDAAR